MAHYLMALHEVHNEQGYARLSDVAKRLKISKGSLSTSLKPLIKKNLILEDSNKHLSLSKTATELVTNIENTCSTLQHFFTKILGLDTDTANIDACKIEHLLSEKSSTKILKMIKALEKNPELLKTLQKEMKENEKCSIKGCKTCEHQSKFCLA